MSQDDSLDEFTRLFAEVDGFEISLNARSKLSYYYSGLVYGEVTYEGFGAMLRHVNHANSKSFFDLGSGTGKAVILASLLGNFSELVGVEIIPDLHAASEKVLKSYRPGKPQNVKFIQADFQDVDFSHADVIYVNATCFEYELSDAMFAKFDALKKGSQILTNTLPLNIPSYDSRYIGTFPFTWGKEPAYLHTKAY